MRTGKAIVSAVLIATILSAVVLPATVVAVYAASYASQNYVFKNLKIVPSGGESSSSGYSLRNIRIGSPFGGFTESFNYTLDAGFTEKGAPLLNPPTLDDVISPTNIAVQEIGGMKPAGTAIYINGEEAVSLDYEEVWSCSLALSEGDNYFIITARNESGMESEAVYATIVLDTVPPVIVINIPLGDTIVIGAPISLEGTVDGISFTETIDPVFGLNVITKDAIDAAGNSASESINVFSGKEPIGPPQQ